MVSQTSPFSFMSSQLPLSPFVSSNRYSPYHFSHRPTPPSFSPLLSSFSSSPSSKEYNIYEIVKRKEDEVEALANLHSLPSDPLRLRLEYLAVDTTDLAFARRKRFCKALRRRASEPPPLPPSLYTASTPNRQHSFNPHKLSVGVDIKRQSPTAPNSRQGCNDLVEIDSIPLVSQALASLGADFLFINVDSLYGGTQSDLSSTTRHLRYLSKTSGTPPIPIVMKDVVISPLQLAVAADAGCDAAILLACVLGSDLEHLLNVGTSMSLDCIVECHNTLEVECAISAGATYLLINRYDRLRDNEYRPDVAFEVAESLPPRGLLTTLVTGNINTVEEAGELLDAGFDGVVIGKGIMGNNEADKLIKKIREVEGGTGNRYAGNGF